MLHRRKRIDVAVQVGDHVLEDVERRLLNLARLVLDAVLHEERVVRDLRELADDRRLVADASRRERRVDGVHHGAGERLDRRLHLERRAERLVDEREEDRAHHRVAHRLVDGVVVVLLVQLDGLLHYVGGAQCIRELLVVEEMEIRVDGKKRVAGHLLGLLRALAPQELRHAQLFAGLPAHGHGDHVVFGGKHSRVSEYAVHGVVRRPVAVRAFMLGGRRLALDHDEVARVGREGDDELRQTRPLPASLGSGLQETGHVATVRPLFLKPYRLEERIFSEMCPYDIFRQSFIRHLIDAPPVLTGNSISKKHPCGGCWENYSNLSLNQASAPSWSEKAPSSCASKQASSHTPNCGEGV